MYLRTLLIRRTKLIRMLLRDFADGETPRQFTLFVGENGLCKTTILRAIALAAVGHTGANKLANAASFRDRRVAETDEACSIAAEFFVSKTLHRIREYPGFDPKPQEPPTLRSLVRAGRGWKSFDGDSTYDPPPPPDETDAEPRTRPRDPVEEIRGRDLPRWFVAGYGVSRVLPPPREMTAPEQWSVDRLRSLFGSDPLIATGFADVLLKVLGEDIARAYAKTLRDVLIGDERDDRLPGLFPRGAQLPLIEGIELRGSGGVRGSRDLVEAERFTMRVGADALKIPATWLSQGYQGTIAWIADLIGQVFLEAKAAIAPHEMEGLVLIDEIDLHLHPRWQAALIPALKRTFPRMQFIATTHSPMVLPGLDRNEVVMLRLDDTGSVIAVDAPVAPALKTGSEIYDIFFGIHELYPAELGRAMKEYSYLAGDPDRSDEEDARMQTLRATLQAAEVDPGWEPVPRTPRGDGA